MTKNILFWIVGFFVLLISFLIDRDFFSFIRAIRTESLTNFFLWMTNAGLFVSMLLYFFLLIGKKSYRSALQLLLAIVITYTFVTAIKHMVQMPRPAVLGWIDNLTTSASIYGFPSSHAAVIFAMLPFVFRMTGSRFFQMALTIPILLVSFSRIYLGVHTLSQVIAGALAGIFTGTMFHLEIQKEGLFQKLKQFLISEMEWKRQMVHLIVGGIITALFYFDFIGTMEIGLVLIATILFSWFSRQRSFPVLTYFLDMCERPHLRATFPARGVVFYLLGLLLAMLIFEKNIAAAAMLIMVVGDSAATVVGTYLGKIPVPLNPRKKLEGSLAGFVAGSFAAMIFVPIPFALAASFAAMFVESFDLHIGNFHLDDNLILPLIAGAVMTAIPIL